MVQDLRDRCRWRKAGRPPRVCEGHWLARKWRRAGSEVRANMI